MASPLHATVETASTPVATKIMIGLTIQPACPVKRERTRTYPEVLQLGRKLTRRLARPMGRRLIERKLVEVTDRLSRLRDDLEVADEQMNHFEQVAEEARVRALVSETAIADREYREAERHSIAMKKQRDQLNDEIGRLEAEQDGMLDRFIASE